MGVKPFLAFLLLLPQGGEPEPGLVAEYFALDRKPDDFPSPPAGRVIVGLAVNVRAGFTPGRQWMDSKSYFCVQYLIVG